MKITTKAAILLLSGTIFFSQASLAGKPNNKPPPKTDCASFVSLDAACSSALQTAHQTLGTFQGDFKADRDFAGLRCKVTQSEVKVSDGKPADAFKKLDDSYMKVWTLASQNKLDSTAASMIAADIKTARDCAEALIPKP